MAEPTTIAERIAQQGVDGIASVNVDGSSVTGIPIRDLIEAEKHATSKTAAARNHLGLVFRQFEPGGTG
jgi:hypothetical protein